MSDQSGAEEAADWGSWLDRFERLIWPVFEARGYTKGEAATVYFSRIPDGTLLVSTDEDEP